MTKRVQIWLLLTLFASLFSFSTPSLAEQPHKTYFDFVQNLARSNFSSKEIAEKITKEYTAVFETNALIVTKNKLDNAELEYLFDVTSLTIFYANNDRLTKKLSTIFSELDKRHLVTTKHIEKLFSAFISSRLFDEAEALKKRLKQNNFELIPLLKVNAQNTTSLFSEWRIDDASESMERQNFDLTNGETIVVLTHPRCHFSQNAITSILNDPDLKAMFETHAHLIAPQTDKIDFKLLQYWNKAYPTLPIALMHKHDEWPFIEEWGTPQFYFLKNGEVKAHVEGWPKAGNKDKLLAAFQLIE